MLGTRSDPAATRQRQLDRWRQPLRTRRDRLRAWINAFLVDHAFFRLIYLNLHPVGRRAWRSAQPLPHQVRAFARRGGRSIVSLRGGQSFGSLPLEREACEAAGLAFHTFVLRSRSLPTAQEIEAAARLFETLDYPVLFHCKSGADRAGFMAALYLIIAEGATVAVARRQLAPGFGHIRQSKTGVLDAFFDSYEAETGGAVPLLDWVATDYDPAQIKAEFRPTGWGKFLGDVVFARE